MSTATQPHPDLTKNQSLVMETLIHAEAPLSAYSILDHLRDHGLRAPLQVYRALDKLVAYGLIHKLESLNAFVACRQHDCHNHEMTAFTICTLCGEVEELSCSQLTDQLLNITQAKGFTLQKSNVELSGTCQGCHSSSKGESQSCR